MRTKAVNGLLSILVLFVVYTAAEKAAEAETGADAASQIAEDVVENTIPVLGVKDLDASITFYTDTLGFKLDWRTDKVCSVSRDGCAIMLSQDDQRNRHSWVWIGLQDDSLFEVYRNRGVTVHQEPKNRSWAYEMKFEDIDGNVLWLGAGPKRD